jgi:hypothetical protein
MPNEILSGMKWYLNQSWHPGLDGWKLTQTWGVIKSRGRGAASFSGLCVLQPLGEKIIPKRHSMKPRVSELLGFLQEVHQFCKSPHSFKPPFFFIQFFALTCLFEISLHLWTSIIIPEKAAEKKLQKIFKKQQQMGKARDLILHLSWRRAAAVACRPRKTEKHVSFLYKVFYFASYLLHYP